MCSSNPLEEGDCENKYRIVRPIVAQGAGIALIGLAIAGVIGVWGYLGVVPPK